MSNSETQAHDDAAQNNGKGAAEVTPDANTNANSPETPSPASSAAAAEPPTDGQNAAQESIAKEETVTLQAYQTLQSQMEQYRDGWQRERAEFANFQRRAEREIKTSQQTATGDALKSVLPVLDDFERAMANVPAELSENAWVNGVGMILRKFYRVLENNNVTIVDPTGQPFDPNKHEAIGTDDNPEVPSGTITATMQKGYLIGDRVLRPALVRVAQ